MLRRELKQVVKNSVYSLLGLGCIGLVLVVSGCSYGHTQALRDARSPRPALRHKAIQFLLPYVAKTTGSKGQIDTRRRAIRALGYTQNPRAIGPLRMVLMHETRSVLRREAIHSLSRLKAFSALQELREALRKDRDVDVRMLAAATLGRLGDRRAMQDLLRALKDPQPAVRTAAVRSLVSLRATSAIPHLITGLCDKHVDVLEAASQALIQMKNEALPSLLRELDERTQTRRRCVVPFLPKMGSFVRKPLMLAFARKTSRVGAQKALEVLTKDTVTWPVYAKILDSPRRYDGRKDLLALQQVGTVTTVRAALVLWYHFPVRYRLFFRHFLGKVAFNQKKSVRSVLRKAVRSGPDLGFRVTALIAIGDTGTAALPVLRSFLQAPKRALVVAALYGLGKVGPEGLSSIEPFLTSHDEDVRLIAMRAVGSIRSARSMQILQNGLKDKAAKMRMEALKGLALQRDKQAIPVVRKMLSDPIIDVVMTSIQTLIKLGDTRNAKMYIQALRRGPYPPKPAFIRTLGELRDPLALPLLQKLSKRYLKDWKEYKKKARRLYQRRIRRLRQRDKKTLARVRSEVKEKLKEHEAVNPMALCAFFETIRALLQFNEPIHDMLVKIGGQSNAYFNPLSTPVDQCPWPSLRSTATPVQSD